MEYQSSRVELVSRLIEGRFPLEPIRTELARYPWDAEEPLATLTAEHIVAILNRYLADALSAADVQSWAEAVELRDDIGFAERDAPVLQGAVFVLANPDMNGAMSPQRARELVLSITERTT